MYIYWIYISFELIFFLAFQTRKYYVQKRSHARKRRYRDDRGGMISDIQTNKWPKVDSWLVCDNLLETL